VHADQQGTLLWSNAYNRRHAYAWPRQPGLEMCMSNMPASTCQHRARHHNMAKHQVSTTDETRRQISKPEQPNGPPDVALQHCKISCRRMHSCCSKILKHAALLKHASRCKQRKHLTVLIQLIKKYSTWPHFTARIETNHFRNHD